MTSYYKYSTVPINSSSARGWAERINNLFIKEISIQIDHLPPVSVFEVPKALIFHKPEAYTPQIIALGPYHHLRPDLYQMERYKLSAIKSISTPDQLLNFNEIVITKLKEIDPCTRACFNKFMDYDQDTLAWIIAIDGCFILNLLYTYVGRHTNTTLDNTIVTRDIMMLENQIPFIHLKKIHHALNLCRRSPDIDEEDDRELLWMMVDFCEAHSPVEIVIDRCGSCVMNMKQPFHLLDLMYHMVTIGPACVPSSPSPIQEEFPLYLDSSLVSLLSPSSSIPSDIGKGVHNTSSIPSDEEIKEKVGSILELVQSVGNKKAQKILKPVQVVSNIPWSTISGLFRKNTLQHGEENSADNEIRIPRVTNLFRFASIKCRPIAAGITGIKFVEKESTLYLPVLNLNTSSEVILRNLIAYEAATSKRNLEFARYINLMNGIIDTADDVKLLRENGVVKGSLKDEEVAELFNGMKKFYVNSSDNSSNIDIAIEEINEYFDKKIVVRFLRQMKKNLYASQKCFAVISTILLLMILSLQSFCEVYGCSRF